MQSILTCIAIDDEPLALELLTDYIRKIPFLQLVTTTTDAIQGLQLIQSQPIDLVFLDIQMPELTGIQFMKIAGRRCSFILTTAYSEFALDGFEFNVIDYLLKPIAFDRFYKAAEKALERLVNKPDPLPVTPPVSIATDFIFVKTDSRIVKLNLADILFMEGLKDYISIVTKQEKLITLLNLKQMEEGLPAQQFVRVHKSYIISLDKIDTIERNRIFIGEHVIPIGETYRDPFFKLIDKNHFQK
jgi:two-component system, LytTR family, response regulator